MPFVVLSHRCHIRMLQHGSRNTCRHYVIGKYELASCVRRKRLKVLINEVFYASKLHAKFAWHRKLDFTHETICN